VWKQLKPGMNFVSYRSHEDTGFVGEAKIKIILLQEDPVKFFEIYGNGIFLTKEELKDYIKFQERWGHGKKKRKLWMDIEFEDVRKYDKPVKPKRFVPVGGQYPLGNVKTC